jgi:hypothetical protein
MSHFFSHTFFNIVSPFYPPFVTLEDLIFNLKVMYILNHKLFENRFNIWVPAEESFKTIPILNTFLRYLKINFWNIAKLSKISWNLAKIYFETICYPTFQTWFIRVAKDSILLNSQTKWMSLACMIRGVHTIDMHLIIAGQQFVPPRFKLGSSKLKNNLPIDLKFEP